MSFVLLVTLLVDMEMIESFSILLFLLNSMFCTSDKYLPIINPKITNAGIINDSNQLGILDRKFTIGGLYNPILLIVSMQLF